MVGRVLPLLLCLSLPVAAEPINGDWLREQLQESESRYSRSNARAKVAQGLTVDRLGGAAEPEAAGEEGEETETNRPVIDKHSGTVKGAAPARIEIPAPPTAVRVEKHRRSPGQSRADGRHKQVKTGPGDPDIYIPPARQATVSLVESSVFAPDPPRFGIVLGTWISGHIDRQVSNADNGRIDVIIERDVVGHWGMLPAGSVLFGAKRFNSTTRRLDVTLVQGITPQGREFQLNATLYDSTRLSGLAGVVVRHRDQEVMVAAKRGVLATTGELLAAATGTTMEAVARGVTRAGNELLANEQRHVQDAQWLIRVPPQRVLIRVDETF